MTDNKELQTKTIKVELLRKIGIYKVFSIVERISNIEELENDSNNIIITFVENNTLDSNLLYEFNNLEHYELFSIYAKNNSIIIDLMYKF